MLILFIEPPGVPAGGVAAWVLRRAPAELRSTAVARDQFRRAGGDQFRRAEADQFRRAAIRAPDQFRRAVERSDSPSCHNQPPKTRVEWLSDNGPPYTANETRAFAASCGLAPRNTPAYSPESNGMAEAFVKTIKRDYVYLADLPDAATVLALLPSWFDDYNEYQPHKGLKMLSPRQFRRLHAN